MDEDFQQFIIIYGLPQLFVIVASIYFLRKIKQEQTSVAKRKWLDERLNGIIFIQFYVMLVLPIVDVVHSYAVKFYYIPIIVSYCVLGLLFHRYVKILKNEKSD
jgi:hypothetical protein